MGGGIQGNDNWIENKERLEHYFTANEVTNAGKKRAVLLSSCGAKNVQANQEFSIARKTNRQNLRWACEHCEEPFKPATVDYCLPL